MANPDRFLGLQMLVTLKEPPGVKVKGIVSAVEAGVGLTLNSVWGVNDDWWEPRLTIPSENIAELVQAPQAADGNSNTQLGMPATPVTPVTALPVFHKVPDGLMSCDSLSTGAAPVSVHRSAPVSDSSVPSFVDPAIVSIGKPPASRPSKAALDTQILVDMIERTAMSPAIRNESRSRNTTPTARSVEEAARAAKLVNLEGNGSARQAYTGATQEDTPPNMSKRGSQAGVPKGPQSRRSKQLRNGQSEPSQTAKATGHGQVQVAGRGKGWRQTPILQLANASQPTGTPSRQTRLGNDNGWASEDVTDIQEMGDFDFERGITKFDKQNLFQQLRKDDQTDDAERLVSHNRQPRPKPGTAGGKNLHYSENVLDMGGAKAPVNTNTDFWNSEADDGLPNGGERLSGRELQMGSRQSSRRGEVKTTAGTRRSQSRKASTTVGAGGAVAGAPGPGAQGPSRVNSGVSEPRKRGGRRVRERRAAREVDQAEQLTSNAVQLNASTPSWQSGLYVVPSHRRVEAVSPLQMLNLENIAHNDVGLTEDMMTENAGRGIAEVTLIALRDPAIQVRHAGTADAASGVIPPPTVVILAGNNKSGMRAVAAARHLRNRGINVLVSVVGLERGERDLLEDMRRQVRLYRNLGGRVFNSSRELFDHVNKLSLPMLSIDTPRSLSLASLANPAPVTLIIDALLGLAVSFDELRTSDRATTYELIEWANRNEAFALSVDVPTGVDPSSGQFSEEEDGRRIYLQPRYVAAIAAPKRGLIELLAAAARDCDGGGGVGGEKPKATDDSVLEWKLFLVDMGMGSSVWKKAGTKIRRGTDFEDKWVLEMEYHGSDYDGHDGM